MFLAFPPQEFAPIMKNSYLERESKKQKLGDEDKYHQLGSRMEGLPRDIVFDIVSRLPVKSIIQFTFVCKTFQNLSRDPELVRLHRSRGTKNNRCLIFQCDYRLNNQLCFVDPDNHDERVRKFETPFSNWMADFNVVGSCEGILCLVNSSVSDRIYIYNPFTRQYKELPKSVELQCQEVMYGFGFHPITKEYKVIKIIYYRNTSNANNVRNRQFTMRRYNSSEVQVISLSENKWRSLGEIPYELDLMSTVALVNGRLHWVRDSYDIYHGRMDGHVISFDLSDEQFREVPTPDRLDHLVVLSGCLSAVVKNGSVCLDIWMMKEYNVKESWAKQFCIKAYSPRVMSRELPESYEIWRSALKMRFVRVLCLLENGEILIEYKGRILVSYNPENGRFTELKFPGMPQFFQTCIHFGSLNWIE